MILVVSLGTVAMATRRFSRFSLFLENALVRFFPFFFLQENSQNTNMVMLLSCNFARVILVLSDLGFCLLASYGFRELLFFKIYEILKTGSLENSLFPLNESLFFGAIVLRISGSKDEKRAKRVSSS